MLPSCILSQVAVPIPFSFFFVFFIARTWFNKTYVSCQSHVLLLENQLNKKTKKLTIRTSSWTFLTLTYIRCPGSRALLYLGETPRPRIEEEQRRVRGSTMGVLGLPPDRDRPRCCPKSCAWVSWSLTMRMSVTLLTSSSTRSAPELDRLLW